MIINTCYHGSSTCAREGKKFSPTLFLSHLSSSREREKSLLPLSRNVFFLLCFPVVFLFFFLTLFPVLSFTSLPPPTPFSVSPSLFHFDLCSLVHEWMEERERVSSPRSLSSSPSPRHNVFLAHACLTTSRHCERKERRGRRDVERRGGKKEKRGTNMIVIFSKV